MVTRHQPENPLALIKAQADLLLQQQHKQHCNESSGSSSRNVTATNNNSTTPNQSATWDLKRDLQPRLHKLERKTQHALVESLRQRLERQTVEKTTTTTTDVE
jgi:cwf18 pre-mRNA splicing factor